MIDDAKCLAVARTLRWPNGVCCPACISQSIKTRGYHNTQAHRQRYACRSCGPQFEDLTDTIFEGHHQTLKVWIICLYFMGLNLSNAQIAHELDLAESVVQEMTTQLRTGVVKKKPVQLSGEVEGDEVYMIAGHKGQPAHVVEASRKPRRRRLKGKRGRDTLAEDKPPILGLLQRNGEVVLRMVPIQQTTIKPLITVTVAPDSTFYIDEYNIYQRLPEWGYVHKTVNHSTGEYARDEDGDGFHEVHINTLEGFWSLLRSWRRPHRGISQEKLPWYLGFFELVHNARRCGKALLHSLLTILIAP